MQRLIMRSKKEPLKIQPQYFLNNAGKKTTVLLDYKTFEQMLERLEDHYLSAQGAKALEEDDEIIDFKKNINN